jgi:dephospho-CoA kinase
VDGLGLSGLRIGLTGGIASGKSTAAKQLVALGARLIDTDAIARQLTGPQGAGLPAIAERFGAGYINAQGLDRDAMRALAFGDPAARRDLERRLHPLILDEAEVQARDAGDAALVFDVPLLVESRHWRARVDRVLLIDCDETVQRQRALQRPGWTAAALDGVLAAQTSRATRRAAADAVIDNSSLSLQQLHLELESLLRHWAPMKESRP